MNYMKEVAHMLGLEIGEEFKIEGGSKNVKYKFNSDYLAMVIPNIGWSKANNTLADLLNGKFKIVKLPKPILDDVEKRYLKGVIRPFRDDVESICKCETYNGKKEYITISFFSTVSDMYFPDYPMGTMYKDMVLNRKYSIEELDL